MSMSLMEALKIDSAARTILHYHGKFEYALPQNCALPSSFFIPVNRVAYYLLLTGKPPWGITKEVQYALDAGKLQDLLDPLAGDWPFVLAEELAHLALRCCEMYQKNWPDLGLDVWPVLEPMRDFIWRSVLTTAEFQRTL
uniref:RING-type E3 ubiquitin transferase n=1 Tax=Fagus sylvatica TaxID=28930 RepID=A0A2N9GKJ6_FAGSY